MPEASEIGAAPRNSKEILETSRLEVFVPHASDLSITDLVHSQAGEISAVDALSSLPQRRSLFYGEYQLLAVSPLSRTATG